MSNPVLGVPLLQEGKQQPTMDAAGEQQVAVVDEHQTTSEGSVQVRQKSKKRVILSLSLSFN